MRDWSMTKQEILDAPLPDATETYAVIPHRVFLEEIQIELKNKGYEIVDERYITTHNRNVISGVFKVRDGKCCEDFELAPAISFVNSYNKTRKAEIRACAMVLVCKNGMMGAIDNGYYARKHTGNALEQFREHIKLVVDGLQKEFARLVINKEEMKNIELTSFMKAQLVGEMFVNEGLIKPTQLTILQKEMKTSEHFRSDSLWDFYNNCTEAFKENHPLTFDIQHIKFHTFICDKFQLTGSRGLYSTLKYEESINEFAFLDNEAIPL